jgi:DNA repair and recombination protein RAD54B
VSPLLKRPLPSNGSEPEVSLEKKARLNVAKPLQNPVPDEAPRTPLLNLQVPNYSLTGREIPKEAYFNVLWRNPTTKKNKTWDGDGVLVLEEGFLTLRDSDGKKDVLLITQTNCRIASKSWMTGSLDVGDTLKMGNKDVEVSHSKSCLRVD